MSVIIETSKGDLIVDLYVDDCPKAATNFLKCVLHWGALTHGGCRKTSRGLLQRKQLPCAGPPAVGAALTSAAPFLSSAPSLQAVQAQVLQQLPVLQRAAQLHRAERRPDKHRQGRRVGVGCAVRRAGKFWAPGQSLGGRSIGARKRRQAAAGHLATPCSPPLERALGAGQAAFPNLFTRDLCFTLVHALPAAPALYLQGRFFEDEIRPGLKHKKRGLLGMASELGECFTSSPQACRMLQDTQKHMVSLGANLTVPPPPPCRRWQGPERFPVLHHHRRGAAQPGREGAWVWVVSAGGRRLIAIAFARVFGPCTRVMVSNIAETCRATERPIQCLPFQPPSCLAALPQHTIFGEIAEGLDVLEAIDEAPCDGEGRPLQVRVWPPRP